MNKLDLWYQEPATVWNEALPVGNGRLGAMVFGDISRDRLQINESTFFSGGPYSPANPDARAHLDEVRQLIFDGRFKEAEGIAHRHMMGKPYLQMSFQPIGDVWIQFHHQMNASPYRRSLDLDTAIATTAYTAGDMNIRREAFVSATAGVLAYRVTTNRPGGLFLDVALASPQPGEMVEHADDGLIYSGHNRKEQGIKGALRFALGARLLHEGGDLSTTPDTIRIRGANSVTILVDAATSYKRFDDVSGDPLALIKARLDAAANTPFERLRKDHINEHQRLFRTLSLDLGTTVSAERPTNERIAEPEAADGPALAALFTQYGRYLTISSSRPGTQPSNLQGLWNEEIRPSWGSKYTTNINLEMNYWLPDPANLSECFEPLIGMVEDLAETGKLTAQMHYGARGWVLHHNTDLWRATAPVDGPVWGLWPMGGAWLSAQLWDHYQFVHDDETLERIYPLMKGATEFLLDYLVEHPASGFLVTVPSLSPENSHPFGTSLCAAPAMDNQIIRDLFAGVIKAAGRLGRDDEFSATVTKALGRIGPDRIGRAGQLQEWGDDWDMDVPEPHHRHVSHLYGLYPSWQINMDATPDLACAARRSLELRGDEATGWGIGWRLNLWARLREGKHAHDVITRLLRSDRTYPNLFDAHPPFQIDGNFGGAAGVIEMLVQSHDGIIDLLPALPENWSTGSLQGARARGAITVDIAWANGRLVEATLCSARAQTVRVRAASSEQSVILPAGVPVKLSAIDGRLNAA